MGAEGARRLNRGTRPCRLYPSTRRLRIGVGSGRSTLSKERIQWRLVAILAEDVAGCSRLMGLDEEGTLAALKGHMHAVVDPKSSNIVAASSRRRAMASWLSLQASSTQYAALPNLYPEIDVPLHPDLKNSVTGGFRSDVPV